MLESVQVATKPAAVKASESFHHTWLYKAQYSTAPGFSMHYIDEGKGEPLLFLHGEPTWGYLFRHQIAVLKNTYRVIVLDHMGFGKSETPDHRTYFLQDHIDNLEAFVLGLDLTDITLVMHDFGSPAGMGLAIRHPNRIKRIISVNGPTPLGQHHLIDRITANVTVSPWFQWILKAEDQGTLEKILGESHYNILSTLKLNGFVDNSIITDTWLEAYRAPFPSPAYALGVIGWAKGYATGQHQFEMPSDEVKEVLASKPAVAIWGKQDRTLHGEHFLPLFRSAFPNGMIHEINEAGHYSPEDAPEEITTRIEQFLLET
jgi:cis-3-alkyl-4-acyloxetan-2-one decarboxylase